MLASSKEYKKRDHGKRPYHYNNIRNYLIAKYNAVVVDGMEADDYLCIRQTEDTIICTRDKDLRMCPGWHYGWEVGKQPEFGPEYVTEIGYLKKESGKIRGVGLKFFYYQLLTGDPVDCVPGIEGIGPVKAFKLLSGLDTKGALEKCVRSQYRAKYGDVGDERMLEQGRLLWMVRELDENGCPVHWEFDE